MKNRYGWLGMVVAAAVVAACGGDDDASAGFAPSEGAVQIGETGVYLPRGSRVDKAPEPTSNADTPVIKRVRARQTGEHTFVLMIDVDSVQFMDPRSAYLDFGADGVYKTDFTSLSGEAVSGGIGDYAQSCRDLLAKQNIPCTDACIDACACVTCGDPAVANNIKLGCATTCSTTVSSGSIESAPYNGSEVAVAYYVYNGSPDDGLPGTAKPSGCDASSCPSGSASTETNKRQTAVFSVAFEAPTVPELTPLVAPQVQTGYDPFASTPALTSEPAGAAQVSMCHQNEAISCR